MSLEPNGEVFYQAGGERSDWADDVAAARAALLRAPDELDLGYVRRSRGFGQEFGDLLSGDPAKAFFLGPGEIQSNRHMWADYVPHPNAIQVLTTSHLDKAADLSNWDVESLTGDRYLVQARDLAPWLEADMPTSEVVDAARHDFGDMILTRAAIEADPHGWVPGRPFRTTATD